MVQFLSKNYKLVYKEIEVKNFIILNNSILLRNQQSTKVWVEGKVRKEVPIRTNYFFEWNNYVHLTGYTFFDLKSLKKCEIGKISKLCEYPPTFFLKNNHFAVLKVVNQDLGEVKYYFVDKKFDSFKFDSKIKNPRFLNDDILISLHFSSLMIFDLKKKLIRIQIDLQEVLGIEEIKHYGDIIVQNNKLFLYLSDGTKGGIYAIDVHTGKLVNHTTEVGSFLKLANDKLYMFGDNELVILNPDTFEFEKKDYSGILKPENLRINCIVPGFKGIVFKSNLLYFVSLNHGEKDNSREVAVGIIDMDEDKLIEVIRFPTTMGSYNINEIQVHENQLFVLTNDSVLHIFEIKN